jgi:hypothetical protein
MSPALTVTFALILLAAPVGGALCALIGAFIYHCARTGKTPAVPGVERIARAFRREEKENETDKPAPARMRA